MYENRILTCKTRFKVKSRKLTSFVLVEKNSRYIYYVLRVLPLNPIHGFQDSGSSEPVMIRINDSVFCMMYRQFMLNISTLLTCSSVQLVCSVVLFIFNFYHYLLGCLRYPTCPKQFTHGEVSHTNHYQSRCREYQRQAARESRSYLCSVVTMQAAGGTAVRQSALCRYSQIIRAYNMLCTHRRNITVSAIAHRKMIKGLQSYI